MYRIILRGACAVLLSSGSAVALAQESGESLCTLPGLTVLTDASGDVDASGLAPASVPLDYADLASVHVAQQTSADGAVQLVFTIKTGDLTVLPPNSAWYTSFKAPDGEFYGARMVTDLTGFESYESYTLNTNSGGDIADGRFPRDVTPADASSSYAADGTITVVVAAANVGVAEGGGSLKQFNAGSVAFVNIDYPVDPPDPPDPAFIPGGAAVVLDGAPNDLSRRGTVELTACNGAAKSGLEKFGGALGFALLLPLALLGLRRKRPI